MKLRKRSTIFTAILTIMFLCSMFIPAFAADKVVDLEITQVVTKPDKNGNEYTRLIVLGETKILQGIEYKPTIPAMAFGDLNETAKNLSPGDKLKAIVSVRDYNGRPSMTIIQFLP